MTTLVDRDLEARLTAPVRRYSAYLFDLDGTVYLGDQLLPGAAELITALRAARARIVFLSNNPTRDPEMYLAKLRGLGLQVELGDIVNTVVSTVAWLTANHPDATVFPIAEPPLVRALEAAGIRISDDPAEIDIVIASYDREFDYRKLQVAFDAIWHHRRAFLITTNPDRYCPFPGGHGEPDAAAIVAAIEAATGVTCRVNAGKPDRVMIDALGIDLADAVMVGDRLATDVRMAVNAGIDSALVLTGDSGIDDVRDTPVEFRPTYILDRIDRLVPPAGTPGPDPTDPRS
ncbi:HAD-IIA family hydrolase [Agromyces binzhouensis]|uniref:HAD-IIA family hydrolase n=1 Tax=Agromyces binzhouensis TaxID=1817495 RepID=A0A4Q2JTX1_9MICO|nr:HAD-IIA family hydrolase [Agromyces binzhouensis]RXZ51672.1 HAD-IIA family hydrolase [Agromyces binzhouensis]